MDPAEAFARGSVRATAAGGSRRPLFRARACARCRGGHPPPPPARFHTKAPSRDPRRGRRIGADACPRQDRCCRAPPPAGATGGAGGRARAGPRSLKSHGAAARHPSLGTCHRRHFERGPPDGGGHRRDGTLRPASPAPCVGPHSRPAPLGCRPIGRSGRGAGSGGCGHGPELSRRTVPHVRSRAPGLPPGGHSSNRRVSRTSACDLVRWRPVPPLGCCLDRAHHRGPPRPEGAQIADGVRRRALSAAARLRDRRRP
ncbi:hypothetical protein SAMN05216259_1276 [Actinacidiphila guanduensis]|uniref:Uncharacterized protein n=1 Tax=Actinacidiphila guanduensis TaxID=310781 RepID=A0A1H0SBX7_9ACTN|nr:hypothetical protein SAMN05216259_1276 [Actinacidiphila guanduensis]